MNGYEGEYSDCIAHVFQCITQNRCCFPLRGNEIDIISGPSEFYERLIRNIQHARESISISSLYIGTGNMERSLVSCLASQLRLYPKLKVRIVLDYSRAQRFVNGTNSVSLFIALMQEFPLQFELYLYQVPRFGWIRPFIPSPYDEVLGVWHAKIIQTDGRCIITGANLSHDYFTNRQDRYMEIDASSGTGLARFYHDLVEAVAAFSYRAHARGDRYVLRGEKRDPTQMRRHLLEWMDKGYGSDKFESNVRLEKDDTSAWDTWAVPCFQFRAIGIMQDEGMLRTLLEEVPEKCKLDIATGYMNFSESIKKQLLQCRASLDVTTASPLANSFYNAKGIKQSLPMAYSLLENDFFEALGNRRNPNSVLREYVRRSWTFHMKGIWISLNKSSTNPNDILPSLTVCGSSNHNNRSLRCDMETQLYLYTKNIGLRRKLHEEMVNLHKHCRIVSKETFEDSDRRLSGMFSLRRGHWLRPALKIIGKYL